MSDQPLFQNTDEQENVYAPQQLPNDTAGARAAEADDLSRDTDATPESVGIPAAGAGLLSQAGGFGGAATVGNPAGPAIVAAATDDETAGPAPDDD